MAMVRKFYKTPGPTATGWGTPIGTFRNSYSEVNGNRKTPNPYTMRRSKYTYSFSQLENYSRPGPYTSFNRTYGESGGAFTSFTSVTEWDTSSALYGPASNEAYNAALGHLLAKMKSRDWNSVVFSAELSKSFSMIRVSATRLYATMRALKRGRLGDAYRALGVSAQNSKGRVDKRRYPPAKHVRENLQSYWLELQMGWKPLLSDIDNAAKAIADYVVRKPPDLCRVNGKGGRQSKSKTVIPATSQWYAGETIIEDENLCQIILYYTFNDRTIAEAKKFGLTTVLPTIWELVPFSWVVDYVIGIGDYLENLTAYQGLDFHSGCVTHKYTQKVSKWQPGRGLYSETYDYAGSVRYLREYRKASGWTYTEEHFGFNRSKLTSFPRQKMPSVTLDFKGDRGVVKTLNLLALFGQFKKP